MILLSQSTTICMKQVEQDSMHAQHHKIHNHKQPNGRHHHSLATIAHSSSSGTTSRTHAPEHRGLVKTHETSGQQVSIGVHPNDRLARVATLDAHKSKSKVQSWRQWGLVHQGLDLFVASTMVTATNSSCHCDCETAVQQRDKHHQNNRRPVSVWRGCTPTLATDSRVVHIVTSLMYPS